MSEQELPIYQKEIDQLPQNIKVEKLVLEWSAPARPYKKRTREFYTTVGSIVFLLGIILILLNELLLIGVIISFAFLSYVLASQQPEEVTHQLTTAGIRTDGKLYEWNQILSFWLKKEWDQELLVCRTRSRFPGLIILVLDPHKKQSILEEVGKHIELIKPNDSFVDKASRWLSSKIPLETQS